MSETQKRSMRNELPKHPVYPATLGARLGENGDCHFLVWAPRAKKIELKIIDNETNPAGRLIPMKPLERGYYVANVQVKPGTQYVYRLNGQHDLPDPASRYQVDGVHGPSVVVDTCFNWTDEPWQGIPLREYFIYELHIGTFTEEGTFDSAINHLDKLVELGITAIEIMPVAQFSGSRNWGYDGVFLFAPQNSYGGPDGLRRLVDACHQRKLAVVLDVVYNHLGPEGNYLEQFGHYFTDRYHTPWGKALNFDDKHSDDVRRFFIEDALYWVDEFHIDALRLDAVHAIFDFSAEPFLQQLAEAVRQEGERLNRQVFTIAESGLNDARLLHTKERGGWSIDAQWNDDLHHSLRTLIAKERGGYYADYGSINDLAKSFREAFVYDGVYSNFRQQRYGNSAREIAPERFVVFSQNHDQIGNRMLGERLSQLVSFEQLKLAAATIILSPYLPLLFMGEEYGETAPFQYFISHLDQTLVDSVRRGRKEEFVNFGWTQDPPDPQSESTFAQSKLNRALTQNPQNQILWNYYRTVIALRKEYSFAFADRQQMKVELLESANLLILYRCSTVNESITLLHFGESQVTLPISLSSGDWSKTLSSSDERWLGPGSTISEKMTSRGELDITLRSHCATVLVKQSIV